MSKKEVEDDDFDMFFEDNVLGSTPPHAPGMYFIEVDTARVRFLISTTPHSTLTSQTQPLAQTHMYHRLDSSDNQQ